MDVPMIDNGISLADAFCPSIVSQTLKVNIIHHFLP